ncbi:hypothetical protein BDR07DRAFT_1615065 [Suillus spraguei]|nr:hypothetical protein BDR07DRAFT_1615065 [Suillus spraguei]
MSAIGRLYVTARKASVQPVFINDLTCLEIVTEPVLASNDDTSNWADARGYAPQVLNKFGSSCPTTRALPHNSITSAHLVPMPAPEVAPVHTTHLETAKTLGHVNLMVDTLIANATIDDLRAITRNLLATGTPSLAAAFTAAARSRLRQTSARRIATTNGLFTTSHNGIHAIPTQELDNALARARSLYGAGMGFASLGILSSIVKATVGLRWEEDDAMSEVLAIIDADISQAMQSCKEEMEGGRVSDTAVPQEAISNLWSNIGESARDVEIWGENFLLTEHPTASNAGSSSTLHFSRVVTTT